MHRKDVAHAFSDTIEGGIYLYEYTTITGAQFWALIETSSDRYRWLIEVNHGLFDTYEDALAAFKKYADPHNEEN